MKKLLLESEGLEKEAKSLKYELSKHIDINKFNNKKSLKTLASDAGKLAYRFAVLNTEITRKYEETLND